MNETVIFRHPVLSLYSSPFHARDRPRHHFARVWCFSCTSSFPVNAQPANHVGRYDTSTPDRRPEGPPAPFVPHTTDMPAPSCNSRYPLKVDESATSYSDFNRITTKLTSQSYVVLEVRFCWRLKTKLPLPGR